MKDFFRFNHCGREINGMIRLKLFLCLMAVFIQSCSDTSAVSMGIEGTPGLFDPVYETSPYLDHVYCQVFETLLELDTDYHTIHPHLVDAWSIGPAGRVYRFVLKKNTRFHNQKRLKAEDVMFSIQRYRERPERWLLDELIEQVLIIDSLTFEIYLTRPYAPFLFALCSPHILVIQSSFFSDQGVNHESKVTGTGPYLLDETSERDRIVLRSNQQYRESNKRPEKIVFLSYNSPQEQVTALQEGEVDIIYMVSSHLLDRLKWTGKVDYLVGEPLNTYFLGFNNTHPLFKNLSIRQAFLYALNRPKIVFHSGRGNADVAKGPLPAIYEKITSTNQAEYDPERARDAFKVGHLERHQSFLFNIPGAGNIRHITAEMIKEQLHQYDITLKIILNETWKDHERAINLDAAELFIYALNSEIVGDPGHFLTSLFHSASAQNYLKYHNVRVDSLLYEAERTLSIEERYNLYGKIVSIIIDDTPAVFIKHIIPHFAYRSQKIAGLSVSPYQTLNFNRMTLYQ